MFGSLAFQLILFTSFFAFCTYVCIIADPETSNVARLFMKRVPLALAQRFEQTLGEKNFKKLQKFLDHGLQIVYLFVVLGSWTIVFFYGYPQIEKSSYISSYHQHAGYFVFIMCFSSWHYACNQRPGNITSKTISLFDHYDYDDVLYTNRICPTLKIRKVARSKYDRFSRKHVPRFDHFCGWLNQAVGEQNYRWFLLFLGVHVFMCFYGSWAMGTVLYGVIMEKNLLNATFFNAITGAEVKADFIIICHYLFRQYFEICGVLILMSVMALVLGAFLSFHLYITSRNMTTNEFFKWQSVRKWHKSEKAKFEQALKEGKIGPESKGSTTKSSLPEPAPDVDVGCVGPMGEQSTSEGVRTDAIFDPGPMPKNIYNKGIIANFEEVIFPFSLRHSAIQTFRDSMDKKSETSECEQPGPVDEKTKSKNM